ncbi:MAG: hypothetical protein GX456_11310, partial [Verrucomicrobia bacterium]|nr:hypothetical protein [Verrucomicrobiota bacterium]
TPAVGSAAVLGRINPTTDPTTCFDHANPAPECSPAGDAQTTCLSPSRFRGVPAWTSVAADLNKGQFAGRIAIRGKNLNIEPVTLSKSPPTIVPS